MSVTLVLLLLVDNLSVSLHIRNIVCKAMFIAVLCHVISTCSCEPRPLVEHNSVIWSATALADIDDIERVQWKFTKSLKWLQSLPYIERLKRLNLHGLELRRLHIDLICWCYKIYVALVDVDANDFIEHCSVSHIRGYPYKLFKNAV